MWEDSKLVGEMSMTDRMIAHYPHGFKNKKWYFRIFFFCVINMPINSFLLYRADID